MKRLYVRPPYRRYGIGRSLVKFLISRASEAGYERMKLETVTFMDSAIALNKSMGFHFCDPHYEIPASFLPITVFMDLNLHLSGK